MNLILPGCRCDGVLHIDGLIGDDRDLTDEDCITCKQDLKCVYASVYIIQLSDFLYNSLSFEI